MEDLRARLHQAMTEQFRKELNNSSTRVTDAISPYTRFVRAEQARTSDALAHISSMEKQIEHINASIEEMQNER